MERKTICVIGLGKFGKAVVETLIHYGCDIIVIDKNEQKVKFFEERVTSAFCFDATDKKSLQEIGIQSCSDVVIAIGSENNCYSSIICGIILKQELKIQNVVAKISNPHHSKIMETIGIKNLVRPEFESGKKTAQKLLLNLKNGLISIDEKHAIICAKISNPIFFGKKLIDLNLTKKYGIIILAIKRRKKVITAFQATSIDKEDEIIFFGQNNNISSFYQVIKTFEK